MELRTAGKIIAEPQKDIPQRIDRNTADRLQSNSEKSPTSGDLFQPTANLFKAAEAPPKSVKASFLPQDPGMLPVENAEVDGKGLEQGLNGARVRIGEPRDFPAAQPDAQGNYLYTPDDPRFDATQAYVVSNRALGMAEGYLGRDLPWGFSEDLGRNQLLIHPHAGANVANAFYSSEAGSLNFFSFSDPKTGEILRTGESGDIVAHETGHALLDAIRHKYISSLSIAAGGFHESFGDMNAMLTAMQDESVIKRMRDETGGDLSKPNVVSRNAEMLGIAIAHITNHPPADTLRSAINNFKFSDQHFYPFVDKANPNMGMGQEAHAYSNLFTGTFYDIFNGLYQQAAKDPSRSFDSSVAEARDAAGKLLYRAVEFGPVADPSYKEMALAFLKADQVDSSGQHRPVLEKVFKERKLLTSEDIAGFDAQQKILPSLSITKEAGVEKEDDANKFLEAHRGELNVPKDVDLDFLESHTTKKGETFVEYGFNKDIDLNEPEFGTLEGSKIRANGGLLLAFDKDGRLMAENFQDVTPRAVQDIKDHLKVAIANGAMAVQNSVIPSQTTVTTADGVPYLQVAEANGAGGPVLQRSPVIWG